ncbi:MAG: galactose mutarotase [Oscillospiraceae bacterium]|nr:galactose mutarotase [Oscillospiraceae bacterium]
MVREESFFGYKSFVIENGAISLRVSEYGATMLSLRLNGEEQMLGFSTPEAYENSTAFIGAIVGRWANRIGGAAFCLNGQKYTLCANEKGNTLHGGDEGKAWNKRRWDGKIESDNAVSFTLFSPDGDNGFPGAMTVRVLYTVLPDRVRLDFSGVSDKDTFFCPTSHAYFSLGEDDILGASIRINAFGHLKVDDALIPTGQILPMEGAFDFSSLRTIGRDYDDCFCLKGEEACTVQAGKRKLTLYTDYPALQFYTGKYLDGGFAANAGFAIEPQFYPDTPNQPGFPDAMLKAGERFEKYLEFVIE